MAKFLAEIRYNAEGARGVKREGASSRREAGVKLIEALGGRIESWYFAFGDVDVYVIFEAPNEASALAASLAINQTGVASARVVPLLSAETVDAAVKLAPEYRGAGQ